MLDILLVGAGMSAYSVVGYGVGSLCFKTLVEQKSYGRNHPDYGNPGPWLAGMFWPASFPLLLPFFVAKLAPKVSLPALPSRKTPAQKVIEYSEAPMSILASMLCQRMLLHPEKCGHREWEHNGLHVVTDFNYDDVRYVRYVIANGATFESDVFSKNDKKQLLKTFGKAQQLGKEKKAAEEVAKANLAALEAIEKITDIPVVLPEASLLAVN